MGWLPGWGSVGKTPHTPAGGEYVVTQMPQGSLVQPGEWGQRQDMGGAGGGGSLAPHWAYACCLRP